MTDHIDYTNPDPVIIDSNDTGSTETKYNPQPSLDPSEEGTMAMFAHLGVFLNLFTGLLGILPPLIIYMAYKDRSKYVAYQSLQALVFQGIFFIGVGVLAGITWALSAALSIVLIGICGFPIALFLTLIPVGALIYAVVAAVDSYHHRDFQYWLVGEWLRDTLTD